MHPIALSDEIAVGEMPQPVEIAILARAGFRSLINVQPDGEVQRLISDSDARAAAAAAGLAYLHLPLSSRRLSDSQVAAFANAVAELPRPIYSCCYSGARAAAAWAQAMAPKLPPDRILAACAAAGFDVSALQGEIERLHAGRSAADPSAAPTASAATLAEAPPATPTPLSAPAAVSVAEKIIFPRAAGSGGFAVSG